MKYPYIVNKGGIWYPAGTEVPDADSNESKNTTNEKDENNQDNNENEKKYSKSDISRMKVEDLKSLASTLGIEVTEESTGTKLKEEIIAKLVL